jgi:hypothetical protein
MLLRRIVLPVCCRRLPRPCRRNRAPPEIRSHVQAIVAAYNSGSAEQWEAMTKEHFAPSFPAPLGRGSPAALRAHAR